MQEIPNSIAQTNDFEFEALEAAVNYRTSLFEEFAPSLHGDVLEVGAGIGQITAHLHQIPGIKRVLAVEPDSRYCQKHRSLHPTHEVLEGTSANVDPRDEWNTIVSINVLEHIRDDQEELCRYASLLARRQGHLCLFVPARQEIYAPIDKDFGHYRRYSQSDLRQKLCQAGFEIERLYYYNLPGYFAWWVNFCLLKKRVFERPKVLFYDRVIFPTVHYLESKFIRPPLGQSLLAVARAVR